MRRRGIFARFDLFVIGSIALAFIVGAIVRVLRPDLAWYEPESPVYSGDTLWTAADTPAAGPEVVVASDPAEVCLAVSDGMVRFLEERLHGDSLRLRHARAARGGHPERPYAVAAELDGPGMTGPGDVAVWSANSLSVRDGTVAVAQNGLAVVHSSFPVMDASRAADPDGSFAAAERCVASAAEDG